MWVLAVVAVGFLGLMTVVGSHDTVRVEAGKRYRFFFKVVPGLDVEELAGLLSSLSSLGAVNIDTSQGDNETVGSYLMTATTTKDIVLGKPSFVIGDTSLAFTKIAEA